MVCCSVFRCAAVCCSVLQTFAVCCSVLQCAAVWCSVLQCVAVCCGALRCVAVRCSVLLCVAVWCSKQWRIHVSYINFGACRKDAARVPISAVGCCSVLQCVAVCCSVLQCFVLCCTVLQCAMTHWYLWCDLCIYVTWIVYTFIFVTWLISMWLIYTCDMTHLYVTCVSYNILSHVMWLVYMYI